MKLISVSILLFIFQLSFGQINSNDSFVLITHNVLAFSGHPKEIHELDTAILNCAITFYKNADIIALQESPNEKWIKILADSLGYNYSFFTEKFKGNIEYPYGFPGAILSKYPIIDTFDFNTLYPDIADTLFQRHWGGAIIETPMGKIQVVTIHLCANWGDRNREQTRIFELDLLSKKIPECDSCIANFLVGDFNSLLESEPYKKVIEAGYTDSHYNTHYPTVPVPEAKYTIDYIFYKKTDKIEIIPKQINLPFYNKLNLYLSDHIPCKVKLKK